MNDKTKDLKSYKKKVRVNNPGKQKTQTKVQVKANQLIPLVDGPEIYAAMGKALEEAQEYIYLTAWLLHVSVRLGKRTLQQHLLKKAAAGVKVKILWCDLDPVMQGFNSEKAKKANTNWEEKEATRKFRSKDKSGNIKIIVSKQVNLTSGHKNFEKQISKKLDREVLLGSHHQKTLVIDGKKAFVSGCDITVDTAKKYKWHDTSVLIIGKGVKGVEENFVTRWNNELKLLDDKTKKKRKLNSISIGKNAKDSDICKTFVTQTNWSMFRSNYIEEEYIRLINAAKENIYIINQYVRDYDICKALVNALKRKVKVTIIIPQLPEELKIKKSKKYDPFQIKDKISTYVQYKVLKALKCENADILTMSIADIRKSKDKGKNLTILSPKRKSRPYVHSKIMIVDNKFSLVGSANLNGRSLDAYSDTELDVSINSKKFAELLFKKLDKASKSWPATNHDLEKSEKVSRLLRQDVIEKDRVVNQARRTQNNSSYIQGSYWGALAILNFLGTEIQNATTPDELRDAILTKEDLHHFI